MINFDDYVNENKTEHNKNWPFIPDHPYRILISSSGSGKTNALLIIEFNRKSTRHKILYSKDQYEAKYQYLIKIREKVGIDHHNDPRAYTEYSNDMHNVYKNINYYNPNKENKILIVFDDMIADMIRNKKLDSVVTVLFFRGRKLSIFLVFIMQSYFKLPKDVRLNTAHFFIAKIPNRRKIQEIARNHSPDIGTEDFTNIYIECTAKPYSF